MDFGMLPGRAFRNALRRVEANPVTGVEAALEEGEHEVRRNVSRSRMGSEILKATYKSPRKDRVADVVSALGARAWPFIHFSGKSKDTFGCLYGFRRDRLRPEGAVYAEPVKAKIAELGKQLSLPGVRKLDEKTRRELRAYRDELDYTLYQASKWLGIPLDSDSYDHREVPPETRQGVRDTLLTYAKENSLPTCRTGLKDPHRERMTWWGHGFGYGMRYDAALLLRMTRDFQAEGNRKAVAVLMRLVAQCGVSSVVEDDDHYDEAPPEGVAFLKEVLDLAWETKSAHVPAAMKARLDEYDTNEDADRPLYTTEEILPEILKLERRFKRK